MSSPLKEQLLVSSPPFSAHILERKMISPRGSSRKEESKIETVEGSHFILSRSQNQLQNLYVSPLDFFQRDPFTIFFKVKEAVRKAEWEGGTWKDLHALFLDRFSYMKDKILLFTKDLPYFPFWVVQQDTKIGFQLENIEDLYPNCILEFKLPLTIEDSLFGEQGFGYYSFEKNKIVLVMCGLPARGKKYISYKITRFLKWTGVPTELFSVESYRMNKIGTQDSFFWSDDEDQERIRLRMAIGCLDECINWLKRGGKVGIFDSSNLNRKSRALYARRLRLEGFSAVFIESICDDQLIIEQNIQEILQYAPDYTQFSPTKAREEFQKRLEYETSRYQTISDDESLSYIKGIRTINSKRIETSNIHGFLASRVIQFLLNLNPPRTIWFSRHGESEYNIKELIGGDSGLTPKGDRYAHKLAEWVSENIKEPDLTVWISTLKRTKQTAQYINARKIQLRALDEIDAGRCDGLTYDQIAEIMPEEFAARTSNKLKYTYPQGESYVDLVTRLEPVLFELERQIKPVLIVSHQAVLRTIYGYFMDIKTEDLPFVSIEQHAVYKLTPRSNGCHVEKIKLI